MPRRYFNSYNNDSYQQLDYNEAYNDNYDYKPESFIPLRTPLDTNDTPLYGVELEMTCPDGRSDSAYHILTNLPESETPLFYFKYDGSVDYGMEMNSHPMTLNFMKSLPNLTQIIKESGAQINDSCGLHIHISRSGFKNDKSIENFYYNVLATRKFMLHLSKRTKTSQVKRFADLMLSNDELLKLDVNISKYTKFRNKMDCNINSTTVSKHTKEAISSSKHNRYSGINLTNRNTVEVRFLKGTLDWGLVVNYVGLFDLIRELSSRGVRFKTPYDLIKMSVGTDVFEWLKDEYEEFLKINRLVYYLMEHNRLIKDTNGNVFYRIEESMVNKYDYILTKDRADYTKRNFEQHTSDEYRTEIRYFNDQMLAQLQWLGGRNVQQLCGDKPVLYFRRIKSVAFSQVLGGDYNLNRYITTWLLQLKNDETDTQVTSSKVGGEIHAYTNSHTSIRGGQIRVDGGFTTHNTNFRTSTMSASDITASEPPVPTTSESIILEGTSPRSVIVNAHEVLNNIVVDTSIRVYSMEYYTNYQHLFKQLDFDESQFSYRTMFDEIVIYDRITDMFFVGEAIKLLYPFYSDRFRVTMQELYDLHSFRRDMIHGYGSDSARIVTDSHGCWVFNA